MNTHKPQHGRNPPANLRPENRWSFTAVGAVFMVVEVFLGGWTLNPVGHGRTKQGDGFMVTIYKRIR